MQVSELLSKKGADIVTIQAEATIATAVGLLVQHKIGALVVSSDGRAVEGILSERDVVRALNEFGARVADESVASVMSSDVHTCSPDGHRGVLDGGHDEQADPSRTGPRERRPRRHGQHRRRGQDTGWTNWSTTARR